MGLHASKVRKHFNYFIIYITVSSCFSQCLKRFDKGFCFSKSLLFESLIGLLILWKCMQSGFTFTASLKLCRTYVYTNLYY